jgi:hypothetical protein
MDLIHPGQRLNQPLLHQPPHIAGKGRRLIHQLPAIIEDKIAVKLIAVLSQHPSRGRTPPTLKEYGIHLGMTVQVFNQALRETFSGELFNHSLQVLRDLSLFLEQSFIKIGLPLP